jgi:hypothetical protein
MRLRMVMLCIEDFKEELTLRNEPSNEKKILELFMYNTMSSMRSILSLTRSPLIRQIRTAYICLYIYISTIYIYLLYISTTNVLRYEHPHSEQGL